MAGCVRCFRELSYCLDRVRVSPRRWTKIPGCRRTNKTRRTLRSAQAAKANQNASRSSGAKERFKSVRARAAATRSKSQASPPCGVDSMDCQANSLNLPQLEVYCHGPTSRGNRSLEPRFRGRARRSLAARLRLPRGEEGNSGMHSENILRGHRSLPHRQRPTCKCNATGLACTGKSCSLRR